MMLKRAALAGVALLPSQVSTHLRESQMVTMWKVASRFPVGSK